MESLPFKQQPHDAMRLGLASLREDATPAHPVETIQRMDACGESKQRQYQMMRQLYGIAAPAKVGDQSAWGIVLILYLFKASDLMSMMSTV
jgi:hypothetical protein